MAWFGKSFFRKSLLLVLCISSLPTALIGAASYAIGKTHIEREIKQAHDRLVKNATESLDEQFAQLELAATQWALDPRFQSELGDLDLRLDFNEVHNLYTALLVMRNTYPLIEQIQIYIRDRSALITDADGIIHLDGDQDEAYRRVFEGTDNLAWITELPRPRGSSDERSLALVHRLPGGRTDGYGALIIHLHPERLVALVDELKTSDEGLALLLRGGGAPVPGTVLPSPGSGRSDLYEGVKSRVQERPGAFGSFVYRHEKAVYSVSFGRVERLGSEWTYVTTMPVTSLTAPVITVSRLLFTVSALTLLTAVALSWFASSRLSRPVRNLVRLFEEKSPAGDVDEFSLIRNRWDQLSRESRAVRETLDRSMPMLKEGFLLQMLQGHFYSLTEEQLRKRMEALNWSVEGRVFTLLYVRLSDLTELGGRFQDNDTQLVTFAAANVLGEIASGYEHPVEVINFQDLSIGVLLFTPERNADGEAQRHRQFAANLAATLNTVLRVDATVLVGKTSPRLGDVPRMLEEARYAIQLRELGSRNQIIVLDECDDSRKSSDWYPFETEKELLQAIRVGHSGGIAQKLTAFFALLEARGAKELDLQEGALQLLGSVRHAMLETGVQPQLLFQRNLYEELQQIRGTSRIITWFQENVIEQYLQERNRAHESRYTEAVEEVCRLVAERYMEELSLERCAEQVGVSPFMLSKTFKQIKGVNFVDYITSVRIEHAKRLLVETDLKVSEIAERVGYKAPYLIRVFKKIEGITPGQYRDEV